jgi:hypothetical protein
MLLISWSGWPKTTRNIEMRFYMLLKRNDQRITATEAGIGQTELGK